MNHQHAPCSAPAVAAPAAKPSGPRTGLDWACAQNTPAMQRLAYRVFARNAQLRAKREENTHVHD